MSKLNLISITLKKKHHYKQWSRPSIVASPSCQQRGVHATRCHLPCRISAVPLPLAKSTKKQPLIYTGCFQRPLSLSLSFCSNPTVQFLISKLIRDGWHETVDEGVKSLAAPLRSRCLTHGVEMPGPVYSLPVDE